MQDWRSGYLSIAARLAQIGDDPVPKVLEVVTPMRINDLAGALHPVLLADLHVDNGVASLRLIGVLGLILTNVAGDVRDRLQQPAQRAAPLILGLQALERIIWMEQQYMVPRESGLEQLALRLLRLLGIVYHADQPV